MGKYEFKPVINIQESAKDRKFFRELPDRPLLTTMAIYIDRDTKIFSITDREYLYYMWCYDENELIQFMSDNKVPFQCIKMANNFLYAMVTLPSLRKLKKYCVVAEKYDKLEFKAVLNGRRQDIPHIRALRDTRWLI